MEKTKAIIFGLGRYYEQNKKHLESQYEILAYADNYKSGLYNGKAIIKRSDIVKFPYEQVIVMLADIKKCIEVVRQLVKEQGIESRKIIFGFQLIEEKKRNLKRRLFVSENGYIDYRTKQYNIEVKSVDELNNIAEIYEKGTYTYCLNNDKKDIVIDVGMNIAGATLFFLQNTKTEEVYGYEPFFDTFQEAENNLRNNGYANNPRIHIYNFGLSNVNEKRTISFNPDMTCGHSTVDKANEKAFAFYQHANLIYPEETRGVEVEVRDAAEVIKEIVQKHPDCNIVLKMDCEGEEYNIVDRLAKQGILNKINFLMLEWHYKGKDAIVRYLDEAGFSYFCMDKNDNMGLIYAFYTHVQGAQKGE